MCDYVDYSFVVEKAYDKIYKLAYKKAKEIYCESLPYLIAERLEKELFLLKSIITQAIICLHIKLSAISDNRESM